MSCIFCSLSSDRIIDENDYFFVIKDGYPVTEGHTLFIPKRCVPTWFELSNEERKALDSLLIHHKLLLEKSDTNISGFNIGMNCGESAGQTVMHCHIHLIPRRSGDCEDPRGGVRGVIPEKQAY